VLGKLILVVSLLLGPAADPQESHQDVPSAANVTVIYWSENNQGVTATWLANCTSNNCQGQID
jgi:hypothetical protein